MRHRRTTIARAEMAYRLLNGGLPKERICERMHCTRQTVESLLRVALELREAGSPDTPKLRQCVGCEAWKPITKFYRSTRGYYGHRCQQCHLARERKRSRALYARKHKVEPVALAVAQWHPAADAWLRGTAAQPEEVEA